MEPRSSIDPVPPAAAASAAGPPGVDVQGVDVRDVDVIVLDRRWHRLVPGLERRVRRAVALGGGAGCVVLADDGAIRRLNAQHRGRNKPTNVLTFEPPDGLPDGIPGGDIMLALQTVRREARAARRRPGDHLAHLVLHGALHLRGHDHHGAGEARRMEMAEARLLSRIGVPNPWKQRPEPPGEPNR